MPSSCVAEKNRSISMKGNLDRRYCLSGRRSAFFIANLKADRLNHAAHGNACTPFADQSRIQRKEFLFELKSGLACSGVRSKSVSLDIEQSLVEVRIGVERHKSSHEITRFPSIKPSHVFLSEWRGQ